MAEDLKLAGAPSETALHALNGKSFGSAHWGYAPGDWLRAVITEQEDARDPYTREKTLVVYALRVLEGTEQNTPLPDDAIGSCTARRQSYSGW